MEKKEKKLPAFLAREETPAEAALREACDAYVLRACDSIRQALEREKAAGRTQFDLLDGEKKNPHYRTRWAVELDVNFKKKDTFFEIDGDTLCFGFAIPVFYVLEQLEKTLAQTHIYPVRQRDRRAGLLRRRMGTETVKVHLRRPESCNGLDAASRDYSAGFTTPHIGFVLEHDFAYFLTDEGV